MEGKVQRSVVSLPSINQDRIKTAKSLVEKAVKLRKVFSIRGQYPVIRASLRARGWVERHLPRPAQRPTACHWDGEEDGDDGEDSTYLTKTALEGSTEEELEDMYDLMSRLVRKETTYFYWSTRRDSIDCRSLQRDQMTNHFANAGAITTKVGLCMNLRNLLWFDTADPDNFFPRCYRLGAKDEKQAFIDDFRRTACTSLLQYVVETENRGSGTPDGQMRLSKHQFVGAGMIDKALRVSQEFLDSLEHSDIDVAVQTPNSLTEQQWAEFLQDYYLVVHGGALIKCSSVFVERCRQMMGKLQDVCPQLDTDGLHNIWIIKPGALSRGRGIMCMNRLDEILKLVDSDPALIKDSKWVVQKYLERPLLIHGTKFDLRQWFLVTDWNPLTIWFYKESYLRFSTQPYSTTTLDSSVHLCNNSIQKHFQPSQDRHPKVPEDNMWSSSEFQSFLQRQGLGSEWGAVVVPGMQQAVVHALQTAQDLVESRKASFELYGADFMLGRDLRPWLLEINASPTMACSTAVTARLCPAVQLDTLRVVLDRQIDPDAYTGGFQLILKQAAVRVPQYVGMNLLVEGAPVRTFRPAAPKRPVLPNLPLRDQSSSDRSSSEAVKRTDKPSSHKSYATAACPYSGKENHSAGIKKRLLASASTKREHKGRTVSFQNIVPDRRAGHNSEPQQHLMPPTESWKKARHLGLSRGRGGSSLVPWTLSCPLGPQASQPRPNLVLEQQRFQALKAQRRALSQGLPSLRSPLPALRVFSLQPNPLSAVPGNHFPAIFSPVSLPGCKVSPDSHKQTVAK